jgi:hypothetical protein
MDAQNRLIKISFIKADAHQLRNADVDKVYKLIKTALTAPKDTVSESPAAMAGYAPFSEIAKDWPWKRMEACSPFGMGIGHLICKEDQCPMWHFLKAPRETGA